MASAPAAGYRENDVEHSAGFGQGRPMRPMRPFNWVQWCGVVCLCLAVAVDGLYFAGRLGWARPVLKSPTAVFGFVMCAMFMINSRREPAVDLAPELAPARRRWMMMIVTGVSILLVLATLLTFLGDR